METARHRESAKAFDDKAADAQVGREAEVTKLHAKIGLWRGTSALLQSAGVEVLEVTAPDRHDRRKRGKNDDLDAQSAAHAAFAGQRTVTQKPGRNGQSLRVLKACRKTAVNARKIALQMIQTRSSLRRKLANDADATDTDARSLASRSDSLSPLRPPYRICLKSLARRYLELHDEIADLDMMIGAIVLDLAPELIAQNSIGHNSAAQLLPPAGVIPSG